MYIGIQSLSSIFMIVSVPHVSRKERCSYGRTLVNDNPCFLEIYCKPSWIGVLLELS